VLLLARLPALERIVGFDRLTIWHRWNGHAVIDLVLAHVVFTVWGYARTDGTSSWYQEYWNWLTLPQRASTTRRHMRPRQASHHQSTPIHQVSYRRPRPTRASSPRRSAPRFCSSCL
jgi:hypothetical protein